MGGTSSRSGRDSCCVVSGINDFEAHNEYIDTTIPRTKYKFRKENGKFVEKGPLLCSDTPSYESVLGKTPEPDELKDGRNDHSPFDKCENNFSVGLDNYRAIGFSKELSKYHPKLLVFIAHGATLFPIGRLDQLKKADEDEKKEAEAAAKKKQEEEGKKKKEAEKKKSKAADASKAAAAAPAVVEQPKTICFRQHLASDVPFDELKIPAPPAGVTPTWKFYVSFGAPCEGVVAVGEIPCDQLDTEVKNVIEANGKGGAHVTYSLPLKPCTKDGDWASIFKGEDVHLTFDSCEILM